MVYLYTPPPRLPPVLGRFISARANPYHDDKGKFTTGPGGGAVDRPIDSWEKLDAILEKEFHPLVLRPTGINPRSGYTVPVGIERQTFRPAPGVDGPAVFSLRDHGQLPNQPLFPTDAGTEPIAHVYRGVSEDEWAQAQGRGYIQSDMRGVIAQWEGTNAAVDPQSAVSYLPRNATGVILKLKVDQANGGWFTRNEDNYLRTRERIPLSNVVHVSPPIRQDARGHMFTRALAERSAIRANPYHDKAGRFTTAAGALSGATAMADLSPAGRAAVKANLKAHGVTQEGIERELQSVLTPAMVAQAKRWYPDAHKYAGGLAKRYGVTTEQAAAVISAVSPRTPWPRNQVLAERVLAGYRDHPANMSAEDVAARIGGGLKVNLATAVSIARGEPIDNELTGVKRRSFFNNIRYPGKTDSVTVDTWMSEAAVRASGRTWPKVEAQRFVSANRTVTDGAGAGYVAISDATRAVAERNGLSPDEVQSAYWIATSGSTEGNHPGK